MTIHGWYRLLLFSFIFVSLFGIFSPLSSVLAQSPTPIDIPLSTEIIAKSNVFTLVYTFGGILIFGVGTFIGINIFRR